MVISSLSFCSRSLMAVVGRVPAMSMPPHRRWVGVYACPWSGWSAMDEVIASPTRGVARKFDGCDGPGTPRRSWRGGGLAD